MLQVKYWKTLVFSFFVSRRRIDHRRLCTSVFPGNIILIMDRTMRYIFAKPESFSFFRDIEKANVPKAAIGYQAFRICAGNPIDEPVQIVEAGRHSNVLAKPAVLLLVQHNVFSRESTGNAAHLNTFRFRRKKREVNCPIIINDSSRRFVNISEAFKCPAVCNSHIQPVKKNRI